MLSAAFISEMKELLVAQQAKFTTELNDLQPHTEVGDESDENATEREMDELNRDLIIRLQTDLDKVEAALVKIEQGNYGVDNDGNEIAEERLRAMPWADKAI